MLNRAFIKFTLGFAIILVISFGIIIIANYWVGTDTDSQTTEIVIGEVKI